MPKNIIICCDGTGNEYGQHNTNVVKLYEAIDLSRSTWSPELVNRAARHFRNIFAAAILALRP